jgi:predicted nucleotidyltransferase
MVKTKTYTLSGEEKKGLEQEARELLRKHGEILFAYLFGSFTGTLSIHDLDIGVYTADADRKTSTGYALDLAEELSQGLKLPVDVRVLNFAPLPFCYHVVRGELLYEKDEAARSLFVESTVQRYLDIEPLLRKGLKEAFAA